MTNKMVLGKLGGVYQLIISRPEDLDFIDNFDEAHWIATNTENDSITCDKAFLKYLDSDNNQKIRTEEIKKAKIWLFKMLADRSDLLGKKAVLRLEAIDTSHDEGKAIHASASQILTNLDKSGQASICLDDIRNRKQFVSAGKFNGDGIITPLIVKDEEDLVAFINDIIACVGSGEDISGEKGITEELLNKFMGEAKSYLEWTNLGKMSAEEVSPILVRGEKTGQIYDSISSIQAKIDEYFTLCRLFLLEDKSETRFHMSETQLNELNLNDPGSLTESMKKAPLAPPNKDEILEFNERINPEFRTAIDNFKKLVFPDSDKKELTHHEWLELKKEFAPYENWRKDQKGISVEKVNPDTLKNYINSDFADRLKTYIAKDKEVADELKKADDVEKLILFQQLFLDFTNNYINLSNLFDPNLESMIQVGTLIMDGRRFTLATKVKDRKEHKKIVEKSNICVMYLTLSRKNSDKDETMEVAVAVTSGFITNLFIGKTAVFFTPDGIEWDAKMIDLVQKPVSLAEAMYMPFKKLGEFIGKQVEKFTSSRYKQIETSLDKSVTSAEKSLTAPAPTKPVKQSAGMSPGWMLMLGGGVSLAALGSAFAYIVKALNSVSILSIIVIVLVILLIIAAPIAIGAIIKLRKRNLSIFLEASGWAINYPMRITRKMGFLFTHKPSLPKDAELKRFDSVSKYMSQIDIETNNKAVWGICAIVVTIVFISLGYLLNKQFKFDNYFSVPDHVISKNCQKK